MSYCIIENFLSKKECDKLLNDTQSISKDNFAKTHNFKREVLSSGSIEFKKLLEISENWNSLDKKLNSEEFLNQICEKLNIKNSFLLTKFFSNYDDKNKPHLSYKKLGINQIRNIRTPSLIRYLIYRIYRGLIRKIKFGFINIFKKQPIELLYDYSRAYNGYVNEIHRDTDYRTIIILIYLNDLDDKSGGGELNIFKNISGTLNKYPKNSDIKLVKAIKPEPGKMVAMINEHNYFHSTNKLEKLEGTRDFIYGGYTLLAGKNPFLKKTNEKIKSAYHLYD